MPHYIFEFEYGSGEADGEDVVRALARCLEEMGVPPSGIRSPLGWLVGFTEQKVVTAAEAEKMKEAK